MRFARTSPIHFAAPAVAALFATCAGAQTALPATDITFTGNVGISSEYILRSIGQTAGKPAVQGGFDFSHASGIYLGTWASNISWLEDFGAYTHSSVEWDFYGGYKAKFPGSDDWRYDVGTLYYYYPGDRNPGVVSPNTWELYGAIYWKWLGLKASYSLQDYFGARPIGQKTDGTVYWDLHANYPVGNTGWTLLGHLGLLDVSRDGSGDGKAGYQDWKIGASYKVADGILKGVEIGAFYGGNNAKKSFYTDLNGYDTAKDRGVVYIKASL